MSGQQYNGQQSQQNNEINPNNMSVINEQGDLGLGVRQLTNEEQELVDDQIRRQRNMQYSQFNYRR